MVGISDEQPGKEASGVAWCLGILSIGQTEVERAFEDARSTETIS